MALKKNRHVGDLYRPVVKVIKLRKGVPTVIEVSGNRYILRNDAQEDGVAAK